MFSKESIVSMANGTFKHIDSIIKGDIILNKFKQATKVLHIYTYNDVDSIEIQLDNGTNTFYASPQSIFFCYFRTPEHSLKSQYCPISKAYNNNACLKSDLKMFSPDSDVKITKYITSTPTTLYSLYTSDNSQSYLINKTIISHQPSYC